jgi:hypothetical protein
LSRTNAELLRQDGAPAPSKGQHNAFAKPEFVPLPSYDTRSDKCERLEADGLYIPLKLSFRSRIKEPGVDRCTARSHESQRPRTARLGRCVMVAAKINVHEGDAVMDYRSVGPAD